MTGCDAVGELDVDLVRALNESGGDAGVEHGGGFAVHCYRHWQHTARQIVSGERPAAGGIKGQDIVAGGDGRKDAGCCEGNLQLNRACTDLKDRRRSGDRVWNRDVDLGR